MAVFTGQPGSPNAQAGTFQPGAVASPPTGILTAAEARDVVAVIAVEIIPGTLALTEHTDTVAVVAAEIFSGTLVLTEARDVVAAVAAEIFSGTLATTEGADFVNFAGTVVSPVTGTLAVTENGDVASLVLFSRDPVYTFEPPSHEEPMRTAVKPLSYYRLSYASSIVRIGGVLTVVRAPSDNLLVGTAGVDYFLGGGVYHVTPATKAELESLGYAVVTS